MRPNRDRAGGRLPGAAGTACCRGGGDTLASVLVAAAVCPHPPLLVPGLAAGAASELDGLRNACAAALAALLAAEPDTVVVVGAGPETRTHGPSDHGSFAAFGRPEIRVGFGRVNCAGRQGLPLSLLVGCWLLGRAATVVGSRPFAVGQQVADGTDPAACADLGQRLAEGTGRVALLVMGDGSARRGPTAPRGHDPRAAAFDDAAFTALGAADLDALAALEPGLAGELCVAGRAPWQVLAGAAGGDRAWRSELHFAGAPYGVGYPVASWRPA